PAAATRCPARRRRTSVTTPRPSPNDRPRVRPDMRLQRHFPLALAAIAAATSALAQQRPSVVPGAHDALLTAGPQAARIGELWNLTVFICTAVFCAVLVGLVFALWRSGR